MNNLSGRLTVYFENPFWVGVFECVDNGKLSAAKVTFGSEPKDCEIYEFVLNRYHKLQFSSPVDTAMKNVKTNPKRMQREIRKQMHTVGVGTKSQQALKLQQEENKQERKVKKTRTEKS